MSNKLEVHDSIHSHTLSNVSLFNTISKDTVSTIAELINSSENPLQEAQDILAYIKSLSPHKATVHADLKIVYKIENSPSKVKFKALIEKFKPNSIEKIAAWAVVIGFIANALSEEPGKDIVVNNEIFLNIEQSWEATINNDFQREK